MLPVAIFPQKLGVKKASSKPVTSQVITIKTTMIAFRIFTIFMAFAAMIRWCLSAVIPNESTSNCLVPVILTAGMRRIPGYS